ncbi:Ig-like domain-containing protein [Paenibacillus sp. HB172176]|uniref:Ig-like domain-containing protein n=1 Tax=Paenibacillus sp. HB172176 TaxID=2493690 RepID=UPI001439B519|nr:Ig-like domain-containing protein [Paenibacillus sp. HB172176]
MFVNRKLSLVIIFALLLQLGLPGGLALSSIAHAASGGPVVLGFAPADNLTSVPLGADLKITFDESVSKGSSTSHVYIYKTNGNVLVEDIAASSSRISLSSNRQEVTIDPALSGSGNKFELNTEYYVLIDAGAFRNVSNGAAYSGIQSATIWNFRTVAVEDTTKPVETGHSPQGSSVSITSQLSLSFNEPVYAAGGSIRLSSTDDTREIAVTSSEVTGSGSGTITITPDGALLPNTAYTVTVDSDNFQDAAGNEFNGVSWSFTTAAAPVNLSSSPFEPADNATLVSIDANLTIGFDQAVQASAGKYIEIRRVSDNATIERIAANGARVSLSGDRRSATIDPTNNLAANTSYYVLIDPGAFTQPAPNESQWFYGISAATIWSFTTGYGNDVSAPVLQSRTPSQYGSISGTQTPLTLTFNENVYPSSGNIEIRQTSGGTLFRSIPITSARVTGGGSKTLTIDATKYISSSDPAKSFVNNTSYYVTIGNRAIRDGAGNFFGGISGTSGWRFTITTDSTRPQLISLSPANGASAVTVGTSTEFRATFDQPVMKGSGAITFYTANGSSSIPGNFAVDSSSNKSIVITPGTALAANTNYYINIDDNAVTDLVGNAFVGIMNQYQWTFLTMGGDTTAPTISKSEVSSSTIRLIYNEPLDTSMKPSPASYYVTVAGAPRNVTATKVEGNIVTLTLSSSAGSNQKVVLSYTKPTDGKVRDVSGNQAASFSALEVSNGSTSTAPTVVSGSAAGNTVVLNFSESLIQVQTYAYTQFTVKIGSTNYSPISIWQSGNVVQLTMNASISSGQSVSVSYSPVSYPLVGISGNNVSSFSNYSLNGSSGGGGGGSYDVTPPIVQSVTSNGAIVTIQYNELLSSLYPPAAYQFSVLADNQVQAINNVIVAGDSVILTLNASLGTTQTVKVSFVGNGSSVKDYYGNAASSFTNWTANTGTGTGSGQPTAMNSAILQGAVLTLSFGSILDSSSVPSTSLFLVRVKGLLRMVNGVQVAGNKAILTLASPANVGDTVQVSYVNSSAGLKTYTGAAIDSFTNENVANQTTLLDTLSGDYEAADGGGVGIKTSGASVTTDTSPAGVYANRYTLNNDKFITAVTTSRDAGLANPRIVFKVPSSEQAANVAISLIALEMANKQGDVTFAVQYGDITYEIPLKTVDYSTMAATGGSNNVNKYLLIGIDQGDSDKTSALVTALKSSKASVIGEPVSFETAVAVGTLKQELTDFSGYVTRTIKTTQNVDSSSSAAVWFDPVTGTLSYAPTTFTKENGVTTAVFKRQGNSAYALVRNSASFSDMSKHWALDSVQMLARKFIVEGHTATTYNPDASITRGEFATYIAKGLGLSGDREAAAKFTDVNKDTVMGAYIGAAASAGIVNGVTATTFKPNSYITRQDMATMMMRAAVVAGLNTDLASSEDSYLQKFTDRGKISSYAKSNMAKSISLGIINGKSATTLSPTANASRAEGAVMIMRLLEKAGFLSE